MSGKYLVTRSHLALSHTWHSVTLGTRSTWHSVPLGTRSLGTRSTWHSVHLALGPLGTRSLGTQSQHDQVIRSCHLRDIKEKSVESLRATLTHKDKNGELPRDDYKEMAVLALVSLGEVAPGGAYPWLKPGATHRARFLNFGIYILKMFMFSDQMGYSRDVVNGLQRVASFISLIYARFFLTASEGSEAPINDLDMFKDLFFYKSHDDSIASEGLEVLKRHGWYILLYHFLCSLRNS